MASILQAVAIVQLQKKRVKNSEKHVLDVLDCCYCGVLKSLHVCHDLVKKSKSW